MNSSYLGSNSDTSNIFEKNIAQLIINRTIKYSDNLVIQEKKSGFDDFNSVTWNILYQKIQGIAWSLINQGIKKGDKIATLSEDSSEVLSIELACMSIGCIYIPIFTGYFPKQLEYVLLHSDPKYLFVSNSKHLENVLSTTATGRIEKYFMINYDEKFLASTRVFDLSILYRKDYPENFLSTIDVDSNDLCVILYTSGGKTGVVKGVEFTHKNIIGHQSSLSTVLDIDQNDVILSYYPWYTTLGFVEKFISLYSGACLTIDRRPGIHPETLAETLRQANATIYFGSGKAFFELISAFKTNSELEDAFFHDKVKYVFSSSDVPLDVTKYFDKKKVKLFQGWGLTETLQYVVINKKDHNSFSYPIPNTEIKLQGDENEILVKGISVSNNYHKEKDKTDASFTTDGWFKTGDAGEITEKGLHVLGRIDSILYLNDNTKLYASNIEHILESNSNYIYKTLVFIDKQDNLSALVFVKDEVLKNWYKKNNGYVIPVIDMLDEADTIKLYKNEISRINTNFLSKESNIKGFVLLENTLSLKTGDLTASFTIVRKKLIENYQNLISSFYIYE